ncbi:MAG: hypothetical protein GF387_00770 [Candidatus Portnoybacteria bacterium]|nr:hypothetical protein [Candidatus Portnoybacteria bacterium]
MKKGILVIFTVLLLTVGMSFAQNTDQVLINLSLTLDEYIECVPGPVDLNLGTTYRSGNSERMYTTKGLDIAYANCPFSVTIEGDNPAGDGIPRFAREETGPNSNGYDQLRTLYNIKFLMNGQSNDFTDWFDYSGLFPISKSYTEAPHNGQVHMQMTIDINGGTSHGTVPIRTTEINPAFTWEDSADAGVYEAYLTVTFAAI